MLQTRSPSTHVDHIEGPLLIAHGEHDPHTSAATVQTFVAKLLARGVPVTYVQFGNEGRGFTQSPNVVSLHGVIETFLAHHLGGDFQPLAGELTDSSMTAAGTMFEGLPPLDVMIIETVLGFQVFVDLRLLIRHLGQRIMQVPLL